MAKEFKLEILTPDRAFYNGIVTSVIIDTASGEMGILADMLPLVTTLDPGIIKFEQESKWMEAANGEGFVSVHGNTVTILVETCVWPYEIKDDVELEIQRMSDKMKKIQSMKEYNLAKVQLATHFARLRLKNRGLD